MCTVCSVKWSHSSRGVGGVIGNTSRFLLFPLPCSTLCLSVSFSSGDFWLWKLSRLYLYLMTNSFLDLCSGITYNVLSLESVWSFSHSSTGIVSLEGQRVTSEAKWYCWHILLRVETAAHFISVHARQGHLAELMFPRLLHCEVTFSSLFIIHHQ